MQKNMAKALAVFLGILFALAFITGAAFSAAERVAFSQRFYIVQGEKLHSPENLGISQEQYAILVSRIISYMQGGTDDLQLTLDTAQGSKEMFLPVELKHMEDVQSIFVRGGRVRWMAFGLCAALLCFAFVTKNRMYSKAFAYAALLTFGAVLAAGILIGLLAWVNFDGMFILFHKLFFANNDWQLPETTTLIRMLPASFFTEAALASAARLLLFLAAAIVPLIWLYRPVSLKRKEG